MKVLLSLFVLMQSLNASALMDFLVRLAGVGADAAGRGVRDMNAGPLRREDPPTGARPPAAALRVQHPTTPRPTRVIFDDEIRFCAELNSRIDRTKDFFNGMLEDAATAPADQTVGEVANSLEMQITALIELAKASPSVDERRVMQSSDKYIRPIVSELRALVGIADWPARNDRYQEQLEKFRSELTSN
jgi:hypothetical protein